MAVLKITGYRCDRCKHEWPPRGTIMPTICPKCKNPHWNEGKKKK